MGMPEEIQQRLDELHDHLAGVDEDTADLEHAVREYRDRSDRSEEDHSAFLERLSDAALGFEASHPELSRFIASVVDSLTAAGI
jgi:septal ring factor EnvC (AmiA/AmiB activator)